VKLERFAVLSNHRRKGVGDALVDAVLSDVTRNAECAKKTIYLHAQVQAIPFWEKAGFGVEGEEFVEADIPHFKMVLGSKGDKPANKYAELAVG
jgi:predicted GNAT family N-acyltransferase